METKNDFQVAINIRNEEKEYLELLNKHNIPYYNHRFEYPMFYYDKQTYIVFDTDLTRKEIIDLLKSNEEIAKQTNEITFIKK